MNCVSLCLLTNAFNESLSESCRAMLLVSVCKYYNVIFMIKIIVNRTSVCTVFNHCFIPVVSFQILSGLKDVTAWSNRMLNKWFWWSWTLDWFIELFSNKLVLSIKFAICKTGHSFILPSVLCLTLYHAKIVKLTGPGMNLKDSTVSFRDI